MQLKKYSNFRIPCKKDGNDGDSLLWAGLMHLSTQNPHSEFVIPILDSQSPDGRFWRAPSRVCNQSKNSFSRDMAVGLIAAASVEKKSNFKPITKAANKWIKYVQSNGCACPDAEDNRCKMTPAVYWLASYAGISVPWWYVITKFLLIPYLFVASLSAPRGYPRHLIAVMILVLKSLGVANFILDTVAKNLSTSDSLNPFFKYLAHGKSTNVYKMLLNMEMEALSNNQGKVSQWSWERADYEMAHFDSMGWEFDFMHNCLKNLNI